jgi:hypothetical protein
VAAERGTTYVLIGQPQPRTGLRRFGESLPDRLLRKVPGVDGRRPTTPSYPRRTLAPLVDAPAKMARSTHCRRSSD